MKNSKKMVKIIKFYVPKTSSLCNPRPNNTNFCCDNFLFNTYNRKKQFFCSIPELYEKNPDILKIFLKSV